ncbi:unnamed protein product, partial [Mesorhabditis spiculigera]
MMTTEIEPCPAVDQAIKEIGFKPGQTKVMILQLDANKRKVQQAIDTAQASLDEERLPKACPVIGTTPNPNLLENSSAKIIVRRPEFYSNYTIRDPQMLGHRPPTTEFAKSRWAKRRRKLGDQMEREAAVAVQKEEKLIHLSSMAKKAVQFLKTMPRIVTEEDKERQKKLEKMDELYEKFLKEPKTSQRWTAEAMWMLREEIRKSEAKKSPSDSDPQALSIYPSSSSLPSGFSALDLHPFFLKVPNTIRVSELLDYMMDTIEKREGMPFRRDVYTLVLKPVLQVVRARDIMVLRMSSLAPSQGMNGDAKMHTQENSPIAMPHSNGKPAVKPSNPPSLNGNAANFAQNLLKRGLICGNDGAAFQVLAETPASSKPQPDIKQKAAVPLQIEDQGNAALLITGCGTTNILSPDATVGQIRYKIWANKSEELKLVYQFVKREGREDAPLAPREYVAKMLPKEAKIAEFYQAQVKKEEPEEEKATSSSATSEAPTPIQADQKMEEDSDSDGDYGAAPLLSQESYDEPYEDDPMEGPSTLEPMGAKKEGNEEQKMEVDPPNTERRDSVDNPIRPPGSVPLAPLTPPTPPTPKPHSSSSTPGPSTPTTSQLPQIRPHTSGFIPNSQMSQMQLQHLRRQAMQQAPVQPAAGLPQNKPVHRNENPPAHSNSSAPKQQTPGPSGINRTPPITAVPGPIRQPAAVPSGPGRHQPPHRQQRAQPQNHHRPPQATMPPTSSRGSWTQQAELQQQLMMAVQQHQAAAGAVAPPLTNTQFVPIHDKATNQWNVQAFSVPAGFMLTPMPPPDPSLMGSMQQAPAPERPVIPPMPSPLPTAPIITPPQAQRITQPQILMGPPLSLASVLPNYQAGAQQQRQPPTFAVGPAPPQAIRMSMNHARAPAQHVKAPSNRPPSGPSTSRPTQPLVRLVTQPAPRPAPLNLTTTSPRQPSHPPAEAQPAPIPIQIKAPAQLQLKPSSVFPIRTMPSPVPPQLQVPSLQITEPAVSTEEPPQVSPPDEANRSGSSQSQGSHGSDVMPCLNPEN